MDTDPMDTTPILAKPREFAQRLARVERARAELIETVARLRAECNDAQAVARAYILRAEAAENKMLREMVDVDVVIAVMAERDAARAEVARLRAENNFLDGGAVADKQEIDNLLAENERLTGHLETYAEAGEMVIKALPALAINELEELWGASNTALVRKALAFLWHCAALRGQPAPATKE